MIIVSLRPMATEGRVNDYHEKPPYALLKLFYGFPAILVGGKEDITGAAKIKSGGGGIPFFPSFAICFLTSK